MLRAYAKDGNRLTPLLPGTPLTGAVFFFGLWSRLRAERYWAAPAAAPAAAPTNRAMTMT